MCTLAVFHGVSTRWPLVVAANRDEFFGRSAVPPTRLAEHPMVVAGRDVQAGGTWLGARIDGSGRIVGVLNRRPVADRPGSGPGDRSRGLLCLESLARGSFDSILAALDAAEAARYGGFNLFVAEPGRAVVIDNAGGARVTELERGLSVLTNLDVNDPRCPRRAGAAAAFATLLPQVAADEPPQRMVGALARVLGDHSGSGSASDDDPLSRVCVHTPTYGTRSSSIIFVARDGHVAYFHAEGAPCVTAFAQVV